MPAGGPLSPVPCGGLDESNNMTREEVSELSLDHITLDPITPLGRFVATLTTARVWEDDTGRNVDSDSSNTGREGTPSRSPQ